MEFNINNWLELVIEKLQKSFSNRLLFIGLQGSYNRNEATTDSDIDVVIILDELRFEDLKEYRQIVKEMPYKEKACGFISGKKELQNWSKTDLFQFFYDTKPIFGNLADITEPPSLGDIQKTIKTSSETLYHAAVHSFVHSNNYIEDLQNFYKMTFFILQTKYFIDTNNYVPSKKKLIEKLSGTDKEILNICINKTEISTKNKEEIENLYKKIIKWASDKI